MSGYLAYNLTGVDVVDNIISSLEYAGNGYHHTSQWGEKEPGEMSYNDIIQQALDACAQYIKNNIDNRD
jgi:hypothetical protein